MKKISGLLGLMFLFLMFACGSGAEQQEDSSATEPAIEAQRQAGDVRQAGETEPAEQKEQEREGVRYDPDFGKDTPREPQRVPGRQQEEAEELRLEQQKKDEPALELQRPD